MRKDSLSSVVGPKFMVPRHSRLTDNPVRPNFTYRILTSVIRKVPTRPPGGQTRDWPLARRRKNVYGGINVSCFPFSRKMSPAGLYGGLDLVPSLGFTTDRVTREKGSGLGLSFDVLTGYSWILFDFLKVSIDAFLNFNPPGLHLSGANWNEANRWIVLPFFDINVGIVF